MATRQEIGAKFDEYDAAARTREQKGEVVADKRQAMEEATAAFDTASQEYRDALKAEADREDELEIMVVDHEPPGVEGT